MIEHLPALQVVVPMVAAPLAVLVRRATGAWLVAVAACAAAFGIAGRQLQIVLAEGTQVYEMGGWAAPYGINYRIDAASAWMLVIVSAIAAVVVVYARASIDRELPRERHDLFYAAYLLCLTGLLGMASTGDAFNVFVFLEISSLSSYVLIGLGPSRRALTAAYRYLIAGSLGGTFILIGIGLMYQLTGTLDMADLATRLPSASGSATVLVSFAFITVGTSLKLALWPLHFWLPNAYTYAPSAVSAFISATSTKVMVYVLMRFTMTVYGVTFAFDALGLGVPLAALALTGIYVASAVAIFQTDAKRLLAYSSVAQIGYMVLGLSLHSPAGVAAALLHMFNHALTKGGMFLALGHVVHVTGSSRIEDMKGLSKVMPWTTMGLVVGGAGLIGVPMTAGFLSKLVLVGAILEAGLWPIAVLVLLASLLAVAYVWRLVEAAWFEEPSEELAMAREPGAWMAVPTWILLGASVVFGVWGRATIDVAYAAAMALLEGA